MTSRIVLVGRIVPSSEKWERIITAGGGKVAITSSRLSMETRALIEGDEGEGGLRLCVLPDHFPKNHLVEYATQWGYACVSSQYVGNKQTKSHVATRSAKQGAESRYNELHAPILCLFSMTASELSLRCIGRGTSTREGTRGPHPSGS